MTGGTPHAVPADTPALPRGLAAFMDEVRDARRELDALRDATAMLDVKRARLAGRLGAGDAGGWRARSDAQRTAARCGR